MKRILVTGATGNLGRAVVATLKAKGITVRAAARDPGKVPPGAGVISKVSGKPIAYQPIPEEAMLKAMRDTGMPDSAVQYVGRLYGAVRAGYTPVLTKALESVLGRKPTTFDVFARQNAAVWA